MADIDRREDEQETKRDARFWHMQLRQENAQYKGWRERAEAVVRRYRAEDRAAGRQFNIFWANVETLKPVTLAKVPKPEVRRRFLDDDPVSRETAEVVERALEFACDDYDFESVLRQARDDALIAGRGVGRVVYDSVVDKERLEEREVIDGYQPAMLDAFTPAIDEYGQQAMEPITRMGTFLGDKEQEPDDYDDEGPYIESKVDEFVRCEFVYWDDYRESPARTWADVWWVAFRHRMTLEEMEEDFGPEARKVPRKESVDGEKDDEDVDDGFLRSSVWEIWDKETRKVFFVAEGYPYILKEKEDPLKLKDFFPCPEPIVMVGTSDSRVPIPEFTMYQDQCMEIDDLTRRIGALAKAIKAKGIYPKEWTEIRDILTADDLKMVGIEDWQQALEKGGLEKAIMWMPIEPMANVLSMLVQQRELAKHEIYELTGISDILRGDSKASETATAQRIKGSAGASRMQPRQRPAERFARDILRLKAEVMAEHYAKETLSRMTGRKVTDEMMQLMRDDKLRRFRIDVETDSTIQPDADTDKQQTVEFVQAVMGFFQATAQLPPTLFPLIGEILKFAIRRFKVGRELEEKIDETVQQLVQQAQQPQPDPNQAAMDAEKAKAEAQMQMEQQKLQGNMQLEQAKLQHGQQMDMQKMGMEAQRMQHEMALQAEGAQADAALKAYQAKMAAQNTQ